MPRCRSCFEHGGGAIVNVSSANARQLLPFNAEYSAAKAALTNLGTALSEEFAPQGVRVNTVSPGPVVTPWWTDPGGAAERFGELVGADADAVIATVAPEMMGLLDRPPRDGTGGRGRRRLPRLATGREHDGRRPGRRRRTAQGGVARRGILAAMDLAPDDALAVPRLRRAAFSGTAAELVGAAARAARPRDRADRRRAPSGGLRLHVARGLARARPRKARRRWRLLVASGADPAARFAGAHAETPLHWAASSDDVEALDALLDAGADIEARGAVIAGGTALADAVAFGQWGAARRLVARGARTDAVAGGGARARRPRRILALAGTAPKAGRSSTTLSGAPRTAGSGRRRSCCSTTAPTPAGSATTGSPSAGAAERSGAGELAAWLGECA